MTQQELNATAAGRADSTLVKRLRECAETIEINTDCLDDLLGEAADRIERLEAALLMIAIPRVGGGQWASKIAKKVMEI